MSTTVSRLGGPHTSEDVCPCCGSPAPCSFPGDPPAGGLLGSYAIVGGASIFAACTDCSDSSDPEWDAVLPFVGSCTWAVGPISGYSIGGKKFYYAVIVLDTGSAPDCFYTLEIRCLEDGVATHVIWTGNNPNVTPDVGVFTRTGGCDMTPTVAVA